ncbi:hypothetical protein M758_3G145500 [Ceratodon purpureus]|nr:hypothetical protein M758_3G145500 [Ceratodon purpureus]
MRRILRSRRFSSPARISGYFQSRRNHSHRFMRQIQYSLAIILRRTSWYLDIIINVTCVIHAKTRPYNWSKIIPHRPSSRRLISSKTHTSIDKAAIVRQKHS